MVNENICYTLVSSSVLNWIYTCSICWQIHTAAWEYRCVTRTPSPLPLGFPVGTTPLDSGASWGTSPYNCCTFCQTVPYSSRAVIRIFPVISSAVWASLYTFIPITLIWNLLLDFQCTFPGTIPGHILAFLHGTQVRKPVAVAWNSILW
jgi:hypothetical protein